MENDYLKAYLFSRHKVQLVESTLVEAHIEKLEDVLAGRYENLIELRKKIEVENGKYYGYLKVEVDSQNAETKVSGYKIVLVFKGLFTSDDVDDLCMKKLIDNQLVAQLYPFARGAIATMSAFMNIPTTVVIPTLDVVGTLEMNDNKESES